MSCYHPSQDRWSFPFNSLPGWGGERFSREVKIPSFNGGLDETQNTDLEETIQPLCPRWDLSSKSGTLRTSQIPAMPAVSISFPSNSSAQSSLVLCASSCPSEEWSFHISQQPAETTHSFRSTYIPALTILTSFLHGLFSSFHHFIFLADFSPFHFSARLLFSALVLSLLWALTRSILHHLTQRDAGYSVYFARAPGRGASQQKWLSSPAAGTRGVHFAHGVERAFTWLSAKLQGHSGFFAVAIVTFPERLYCCREMLS